VKQHNNNLPRNSGHTPWDLWNGLLVSGMMVRERGVLENFDAA